MKAGDSATYYCVRCRAKKTTKVQLVEHKKNADMLIANCPTCKTKMCRFAAKT